MNINISTLINGDYIMEILLWILGAIIVYGAYVVYRDAKGTGLDVNNDGKVDLNDVKAAVEITATAAKADVAKVTAAADVNKDGKVDAADAKAAVSKAKAAVKKATTKKKVAPKKKAATPKKKAVSKKKATTKKK